MQIKGGQIHHGGTGALGPAHGGEAGDGVGHPFAAIGGAVHGIERDVIVRRAFDPGADAFPFEDAGRVVLDALTDHDLAADVHQIEHAAHGIAGGGIGGFLVTFADPLHDIERCDFRSAEKVKFEEPLHVIGRREVKR